MDKILENTLLFDYYGSLLTNKQYETYAMYFNEDLTLQEIANIHNTSKQAVSDLLKRTHKNLNDIEEKLQLVDKHETIRQKFDELFNIIGNSELKNDNNIIDIKQNLLDLL